MTEAQARALYRRGEGPTIRCLLEQNRAIEQLKRQVSGQQPHPSTPSGMLPVYAKPEVRRKGGKPGRKNGHPASRRAPPERIDRTVEHTLEHCPRCRNKIADSCTIRSRYVEDIPPVQPRVTEHRIHRYWCSLCRRIVEPPFTDALPKCVLGLRTVVYSAWLHYGLGLTLDKIVELLNVSASFKVSPGGLLRAWRNLAIALCPAYDRLAAQARHSAVLHADETGWRVNGSSHWLWCFTSPTLVFFLIDRCRGSPVVHKVLGESFDGVLVADFYGAYNKIAALSKQRCLVHLFRELAKVDLYDGTDGWKHFRARLRRLLKDAFRLARERRSLSRKTLARRKQRFLDRLDDLCVLRYPSRNARRLAKRLQRYRDEIFTFLDHPDVAPDNNHAERQVRPAVIIRKNSYGNRSHQGAEVQAVLMSLFRTLHLRQHHPVDALTNMAAASLASGAPPTLPEIASHG
jgi:transposase